MCSVHPLIGACVAFILSYEFFAGCVTTVFVFLTNTVSSSEEVKANALRSAILTFRLRQLQTIVQSLPVDQRPKTMTELRDLLHKHNTLQVSSPQDLTTCAKKNLPTCAKKNLPTCAKKNLPTCAKKDLPTCAKKQPQCVCEHSVNPCTYEY